jgi:TRAP-type uncharacterized transport system fused permease subunit
MIVIEIREETPVESSHAAYTSVPHFFDAELLIASPGLRCLCSFAKGAVAAVFLLLLGGISLHSLWAPFLILYVASLCCLCTWTDQRLSHAVCSKDVWRSLRHDLRSIHPAFLALAPVSLLICSMSLQSLLNTLASLIEVVGIAFGVPLLIFGVIKWTERSANAIGHLKLGATIVTCGMTLSIIFGIVTSRLTEVNSFSQANYFADAISAIYSPSVVLPIGWR